MRHYGAATKRSKFRVVYLLCNEAIPASIRDSFPKGFLAPCVHNKSRNGTIVWFSPVLGATKASASAGLALMLQRCYCYSTTTTTWALPLPLYYCTPGGSGPPARNSRCHSNSSFNGSMAPWLNAPCSQHPLNRANLPSLSGRDLALAKIYVGQGQSSSRFIVYRIIEPSSKVYTKQPPLFLVRLTQDRLPRYNPSVIMTDLSLYAYRQLVLLATGVRIGGAGEAGVGGASSREYDRLRSSRPRSSTSYCSAVRCGLFICF